MWVLYQYRRIWKDVERNIELEWQDVSRPREHEQMEVHHKYDEDHTQEEINSLYYNDEVGSIDAHSWHKATKWMATVIVSSIAAVVAMVTAIQASLVSIIAEDFQVSQEAENCATGMFLFGFAVGSLVTGPFSETIGRNLVFIITMALMMCCLALLGIAHTLAQQLVFRFLAGFLGSSPLVCAGGSISDMWTPVERVYVFPVFAIISFFGTPIAPIIGGYLARYNVIWRWNDWISICVTGFFLLLVILILPETFKPLLSWAKTHAIRKQTRKWEVPEKPQFKSQPPLWWKILDGLWRPFILTAYEPIVMLFTFYLSLIYIILLSSLSGYNFIFSKTYDFDNAQTGLTFLGMLVGAIVSAVMIPYGVKLYGRDLDKAIKMAEEHNENQRRDHSDSDSQEIIKTEDVSPPPESQLYYAMFGAPFIPASLFWMAYTARPDISFWCPLVGSSLFGFGFSLVFVSCYQYLASCYGIWTASALSAVNCLRALMSGGMFIAATPMYQAMGVMWTLTMLAIVSAIMVPVPYAFWKWGRKVRKLSKHACKD
ncbi:major facilitator superfamily domain-containing protein [Aspergillus multicolor]|uniref:major facilitator superfamily domain-containing protein n=1 Tax=Aspergillus multicolor TaxID=41759 RepID=UPI003CCE53E5